MKRLLIYISAFFLSLFALSFTTPEQRRELIWDRVMADGTPNMVAGWDANGDPAEISAGNGDMVLAEEQISTGKKTFQPDIVKAGLNIGSYNGTPGTLEDADVWYDSTTDDVKVRVNGETFDLGATLRGSQVHDFASVAANVGQAVFTINVNGADPGDPVAVGLTTFYSGSIVTAYCHTPNTVTVMFTNISAAAIDPAAVTYTVTVFK